METGPDMRTLLVTGGAGFIGSNFIPFYLDKNPSHQIVNLDKLTYAGNLLNLIDVVDDNHYHFFEGDICDKHTVDSLFDKFEIDGVIHFAAESHVDNSIADASNFVKTNIEGTHVLLEAAKRYWMTEANELKPGFEQARFHHISTDEVYGSLGAEGFFTEETPYAPNSPYSASKAASDFLVRSYGHTYGLPVVTTNCSNNYGPKQHDEKLIPTIIRHALSGKPIPIYGNGKNIRDWLYVEDHCIGINMVFESGVLGETYIIGGDTEHTNIAVAERICAILDEVFPKEKGSYNDQITFVKDRLGHDWRYAIDAGKMKSQMGWKPRENFDSGLRKTVAWCLEKYQKV